MSYKDFLNTIYGVFGPKSPAAPTASAQAASDAPKPTGKDWLPTIGATKAQGKAEPKKPPKKWISAGGVVVESETDLDHIYICAPAGKFGGYSWVFPKGQVEKGESLSTAALREVEEETGLKAKILPGGYLGTGVGTSSITHYYIMVKVGGAPKQKDKEMDEVRLVTWKEALKLFSSTHNSRDVRITMKAWDYVRRMKKRLGIEQPKAEHAEAPASG